VGIAGSAGGKLEVACNGCGGNYSSGNGISVWRWETPNKRRKKNSVRLPDRPGPRERGGRGSLTKVTTLRANSVRL
jgi:hypothetical protein